MTEQCQANTQNVSQYMERFHLALKIARVCVFEVDLTQQLYTCFDNAEDIFGVSGQQILKDLQPMRHLSPKEYERAVMDYLVHPDDTEVVQQAFQDVSSSRSASCQARVRAGRSPYIWCKMDLTPLSEAGIPTRMVGVITDIRDFQARAEKLVEEARTDCFTGLYHKLSFEQLAERVLQNYPEQRHALILFDLDNFKEINNTYGHLTGDAVLRSIAGNLRRLFPKPHLIGRVGGDEFVILLQNLPNDALLQEKMQALLQCDDNALQVTKSAGVAIYPDDTTKFSDLLRLADLALYRAKQKKNTMSFYMQQQAQPGV